MGYTDIDRALVQLELTETNDDDANDIALLAEIDEEISRTLGLKTGRKWGGTATTTARIVDRRSGSYGDILLLPSPVRSVSSVSIIGDSPETVPSTDYVLWNVTKDGDAHALKRTLNGYWPIQDNGVDRVVVTAVWSDESSGEGAPQEIVDAATFVAVETFRQRKSSPTGEIGPDGLTMRPRNPWRFETVQEAIKKYENARSIASF